MDRISITKTRLSMIVFTAIAATLFLTSNLGIENKTSVGIGVLISMMHIFLYRAGIRTIPKDIPIKTEPVPRTVKYWLNTFSSPLREKAFVNIEKMSNYSEVLNLEFLSPVDAIKVFDWEKSTEGYDYWNNISQILKNEK